MKMLLKIKNLIRRKTKKLRWSLASSLIGFNTRRAIYFGPDAMTITWESDRIVGQSIQGAHMAFLAKNGKKQTVFAPTKDATKAD